MIKMEQHKESFFKGLFWAILFSIPLWLSIFGWLKILKDYI
jgi:hypothetical protein